MKENGWNYIFSESFLKTLKEVNKNQLQASALAISQALETAVSDYKFNGAYTALSEIIASQEAWREMSLSVSSLSAKIAAAFPTPKLDLASITQSVMKQLDTSAFVTLKGSASMAASITASIAEWPKTDWSWLSEVYNETDDVSFPDSIAEEEMSPEIRLQMAADITEVLSEPERMHIASQNKYLKWFQESPEHALQFLNTLLTLIGTILTALSFCISVWQARTIKDSQVYEEPTSKSSVVYNLTVENNITVIGDVPYYYEVEFTNPETGELVTGYIYKGNVIAEEPDEPDEAESHEEEIEDTEEPAPISDTTMSQTEPTE